LLPLAGKTAKVLVVDLDNTLWDGIVGEDGFDGIELGSEYPGAVFQELQRTMLDLYRRGVLLAICSKNNREDAIEVLEKHPSMLLRPQHFAAMRISWNDKTQGLREIAAELNVGIDSLAFLDDNPVEREQVRRKASESIPTLSSAAISRRPCVLSFQLIRMAAKCSGRSSMLGCFSKTSIASSRLFLLQIARRTPLLYRSS